MKEQIWTCLKGLPPVRHAHLGVVRHFPPQSRDISHQAAHWNTLLFLKQTVSWVGESLSSWSSSESWLVLLWSSSVSWLVLLWSSSESWFILFILGDDVTGCFGCVCDFRIIYEYNDTLDYKKARNNTIYFIMKVGDIYSTWPVPRYRRVVEFVWAEKREGTLVSFPHSYCLSFRPNF